ncbi:TrlF family AAA-like ATPase [Staphylococcus xylosus]|uniref:TrlF family AAA-like ATPase n=1 Tax=Staphylococcus xylosus TaxID=1288 RepID=UPI000E687247|nr:hypothetical protein [Staphylococcus xylosus]RIM63414.1 hypothetical protein BU122_13455 [Staphylococcus xylosus]
MKINRGSEWNIWDLHIHTPDTWLNNNFKHKDWETYITTIENKNVKVLGITNYFNVEDYFKVKEFKKSGRLENIELILPNVELRLNDFTSKSKGVNFHVIFSDKVDEYIQELFLDKLSFSNNGNSYSCNKKDLIRLGRDFKNNHNLSEKEALEEGLIQFKVDIEEIVRTLKNNSRIFDGNYLMGASNKSSDGASGLQEGQQASQRQRIYNYSDFVFSSNQADKEFFLNNNILDKLIPCIHGSDAHEYKKICEPDNKRYTWIKGELSFEGLQQIKHEPSKRVKIQSNHPENKINYNVIDKIQFKEEGKLLGKNSVYLSSGLNVIIGGKSSGKSILLYKIAQIVNSSIINKIESENLWNNNYKGSKIDDLRGQVFWKDGTYSNIDDDSRQLLYIPQMYINNLAEQYRSELLQNKIKMTLLENPNILKSFQEYNEYMKTYNSSIESEIEKIKIYLKEEEIIDESIRNIGNVESIGKEIERLKEQLQKELKESEITKEEQQTLKVIESEREEISKTILKNEKTIQESNDLREKIQKENGYVKSELEKSKFENDVEQYKSRYLERIKSNEKEIVKELEAFEKDKENIIKGKNKEVVTLDNQLKPINEKLRKKELIEKLNEKIKIEKNKKIEIEKLTNKRIEMKDAYILSIDKIKEIVNGYYQKVNLYRDTINNHSSNIKGIKIVPEPMFNHKRFSDEFINRIDRRKLNNPHLKEIIDEDGYFKIDNLDNFPSLISNGIDKLLKVESNIFKKDLDRISMIRYMTVPYYEITLNLSDGEDLITEMSPGKSGLIILKLLTYVSNEKFPILIDQPEDNLDNRTISKELVNLIRDISEQRQIIMVTHNANLAVLTDSENVIVANQDVSEDLKENKQVRFEYKNGALESIYNNLNLGNFHGKSIQEHVFDILEGGQEAFKKRESKYINFK